MKKLLCIFMVCFLGMSLCACNKADEPMPIIEKEELEVQEPAQVPATTDQNIDTGRVSIDEPTQNWDSQVQGNYDKVNTGIKGEGSGVDRINNSIVDTVDEVESVDVISEVEFDTNAEDIDHVAAVMIAKETMPAHDKYVSWITAENNVFFDCSEEDFDLYDAINGNLLGRISKDVDVCVIAEDLNNINGNIIETWEYIYCKFNEKAEGWVGYRLVNTIELETPVIEESETTLEQRAIEVYDMLVEMREADIEYTFGTLVDKENLVPRKMTMTSPLYDWVDLEDEYDIIEAGTEYITLLTNIISEDENKPTCCLICYYDVEYDDYDTAFILQEMLEEDNEVEGQ